GPYLPNAFNHVSLPQPRSATDFGIKNVEHMLQHYDKSHQFAFYKNLYCKILCLSFDRDKFNDFASLQSLFTVSFL
ncbi:MAG: hypothetical protein J6P29_06425, partial [Acetobacter sp.]|nr:hypothetical protein [Acetobacter sp.]